MKPILKNRYIDYRTEDMTNGEGVRVSLFVSGCSIKCPGCWNPQSWNPRNGSVITKDFINRIMEDCGKPHIQGLSILGGEPTESLDTCIEIVKKFRNKFGVTKDIWIWSGYSFEELIEDPLKMELIKHCDVLIEGPFLINQRNVRLKYRGSENQRVIDVKASISSSQPVLYCE